YYGDSQTSCTTSTTAPTPTSTAPVHLEYNGLVLPSLDDPLPPPKGNDVEEEKKKKEEAAKQSNQADQEKAKLNNNSVSNSQDSKDGSLVSTKAFPNAVPQTNPQQFQQFLKGQQPPPQFFVGWQPPAKGQARNFSGNQPQVQGQPQNPPLQSQLQQFNQQWNPFRPGAFVTYNLENKPVTPIALGGPQTYTIVPTKEEQEALAAKNKAAAEASKKAAQDNGLKTQQGQQSQAGHPLPQLQPPQ
ncbi:hypothetical protein CONCODRAFT_13592, partial [Conidiobolus coronatus NRRL 28638]